MRVPVSNALVGRNFCNFKERVTFKGKCEKQESNLRTPTGTDLEPASFGHLDILAQNNGV